MWQIVRRSRLERALPVVLFTAGRGVLRAPELPVVGVVPVDKKPGEIVRENDGCIALVGDTQAKLTFSDPTRVHKVVLMHGAKAEITATGYAVVRLINIGNCEVKINKQEHAVILN